jgi:hypothetical protein
VAGGQVLGLIPPVFATRIVPNLEQATCFLLVAGDFSRTIFLLNGVGCDPTGTCIAKNGESACWPLDRPSDSDQAFAASLVDSISCTLLNDICFR